MFKAIKITALVVATIVAFPIVHAILTGLLSGAPLMTLTLLGMVAIFGIVAVCNRMK